MNVTILGLGYIGLPTATLIANKGIQVFGFDIDPYIREKLKKGQIHIKEPELDLQFKQALQNSALQITDTPVKSDIFIVVVPTPFKGNHEPDISYVEAATRSIIPLLEKDNLLIIESTSPVGTTDKMAKVIFNERPELKNHLHMAYCPERVLPGNVMYELENNDRVIGGIDEPATEKALEFYRNFVSAKLHKTNARTAEMCKLVENSSRDVQIAFANELSLICDKADINVWELIELANRHPRVNILQPGSGVGGHCIAVDPYFIASEFPIESQLISKAREINNYKSIWVAEKIKSTKLEFQLKHGRIPSIACMGLAFKPNIDDLRESPAKYIAQKVMQDVHDETLYVVEPNIANHKVFKLTDYRKAYEHADIIAFLVNHNEFKSLPWHNDKVILDFCGVFKK